MRTGQWNVCLMLLVGLVLGGTNVVTAEDGPKCMECHENPVERLAPQGKDLSCLADTALWFCSKCNQLPRNPVSMRACGCDAKSCDCQASKHVELTGPANLRATPAINRFAVIPASFVEEFDESAEEEVVVLEPVAESEIAEQDRVGELMEELAKRSHHNREIHNIVIPSETKPLIKETMLDEEEPANSPGTIETVTTEPAKLDTSICEASVCGFGTEAGTCCKQEASFELAKSICKCTSMGCGMACQTANCRPVSEVSWKKSANQCQCGTACKCGSECKCNSDSKCGSQCSCDSQCNCGSECKCGSDCSCGKTCKCPSSDSSEDNKTEVLIQVCSEIDSIDQYTDAIAMIVDQAGDAKQKQMNRALLALANAKLETMLHMVDVAAEVQAEMHDTSLENARMEAALEANEAMLEFTAESLQVLMTTGAATANSARLPAPVQPMYQVQRPTFAPPVEEQAETRFAPIRTAELPAKKSNPAIHEPRTRSSMPVHRPEKDGTYHFTLPMTR